MMSPSLGLSGGFLGMPIPSGGGWDVPCEGNLLGMPIPSMSEGVPCEGGDMGWGCIMPIPCGGGWDMPCEGGACLVRDLSWACPYLVAGAGSLLAWGSSLPQDLRLSHQQDEVVENKRDIR